MRKFTLKLEVADRYDRFDSEELRNEVMLFLDRLSLDVESASSQWNADPVESTLNEELDKGTFW